MRISWITRNPGQNSPIMEPAYQGKIKGWFLTHLGLTQSYEHLAEVPVIRGRLGFRRR